jgi:rod shape-determining protein MreC
MESFLSRYRNPLVLLAVVLAQLLGLAVQVRRPAGARDSHQVRLIRYWVVGAISPFERAFLAVGHGFADAWGGYLDLRNVRAKNAQLQEEVNRLRMEQASLSEAARQDIRLRNLLAFQEQYVSKTVAAHVIGTGGSDLSRVLYIDKGSKDGLRPDLAVITPNGVVGKVLDVFPHTAQVLEINDPTSGLGVILTKTRLRGILRGGKAGRLEIVNVMPDEHIPAGETVVTSGGDQIYPRGLPVGTVEKVVKDPQRDPYVAVLVRPAVSLSRLDEVLVITQTAISMPNEMSQDLTSSDQSAAAILSQRLPGANLAPEVGPDGEALDPSAVPPPVRPPAALHPDRFTPGDTPPASDLVPGAAYAKHVFSPASAAGSAAPTNSASAASDASSVSAAAAKPLSPAFRRSSASPATAANSASPDSGISTKRTHDSAAAKPSKTPANRPAPAAGPQNCYGSDFARTWP